MKISNLVYGWSKTRLPLTECITLILISENAPLPAKEISTIRGQAFGTCRNSIQILKKHNLVCRTRKGYCLTRNGVKLIEKWGEGSTNLPKC